MIKKKCISLADVFIFLILIGCESEIDFPDVPETKPVAVIEALLTDRFENQKVRVSYSVSLLDTSSSKPVSYAEVFVCSALDTYYYSHNGNGWYVSEPFRAIVNNPYNLEVRIDSSVYKSTGTPLTLNGIDSLFTGYFPVHTGDDSAYSVYMDVGNKDASKTGYYYINAFRNNIPVSTGSNVWVFDDKYVKSLHKIELPYTFKKEDTVTVELYSLTKEMYDYYYVLLDQFFIINYQNIWYKSNPPVMFEGKAMGYFQVSSVSEKTIIVR